MHHACIMEQWLFCLALHHNKSRACPIICQSCRDTIHILLVISLACHIIRVLAIDLLHGRVFLGRGCLVVVWCVVCLCLICCGFLSHFLILNEMKRNSCIFEK
jgi:hypothetical protein